MLGGMARAYDVLSPEMIAGPEDAAGKCEQICAPLGGWNGGWANDCIDFQEQQISVCGCNKKPDLPACSTMKTREKGGVPTEDCLKRLCSRCSTEELN
jgi:hypothetical protein